MPRPAEVRGHHRQPGERRRDRVQLERVRVVEPDALPARLAEQFVWGSDFPFISPERCLGELEELGLDSPVLLRDNAARVLGLTA